MLPDCEIGDDTLEPGQIWIISESGHDTGDSAGLYRVEVNAGPATGVKILNNPAPAPFEESVRYEQNFYARGNSMVGDLAPRSHEYSVQLRAFDAAKKGAKLGVPVQIAMSGALLKKSVNGGLIVVGELNRV